MTDLFRLDGSVLEGGGQILRIATTLSVLRGIPISIKNIRAGRSTPGLRPQHLKGLEIARNISQGKLLNATENSEQVAFYPGKLIPGHYFADTKTAGSVCLMIQVALPCALFSSGETVLQLIGGTNAAYAPQIDHTTTVFRPILMKFGASFESNLKKRGFFPKGGGEVEIKINPISFLKSVDLTEPGKVERIWGTAFVAGSMDSLLKMMEDMASSAERALKSAVPGVPIDIRRVKERREDSVGFGSGICLFAETSTGCILGGTALGVRGGQAQDVGKKAAQELIDAIEANGCVDQYTQDQIIIYMALANGKSRVKCGPITLHTETAIHVIQLMTLARFEIKKEPNNSNIIECNGIGMMNDNM